MSNKFRGLHGPITKEAAEAEPEDKRLFNRPPRPISPETRALFKRIVLQKDVADGRRNDNR
jgi:hypothetical protein